MRPEDIEKTKKVIQQASILSSVEKAEWVQLLSEMSDKEVNELVAILQNAATPFPAEPVVLRKAPLPPKPPKVDIKQKEISTSIPFYELELAEHSGAVPPTTVHVPINGKIIPAPSDPAELQNRVESIVKDLQHRKDNAMPESSVPVTAAAPLAKSAPEPVAPLAVAKPAVHGEPLVLKTAEDFAKIEPKNIHGDDPYVELQTILSYMVQVGQRNKIYEVIDNFEKSLLYRTYMNIGLALLNDPNPDREASYNNVLNTMQRNGQQWLSKDEFEAFADFRKNLDQMV
ncbi:MAG: hypothetical protein JWO40_828 [Candidatus Doudnabacteria bacterium]|nr:hypothetical protein [Candidatus Doudnabacteria bacterium]